jgi:hypothetical protein
MIWCMAAFFLGMFVGAFLLMIGIELVTLWDARAAAELLQKSAAGQRRNHDDSTG